MEASEDVVAADIYQPSTVLVLVCWGVLMTDGVVLGDGGSTAMCWLSNTNDQFLGMSILKETWVPHPNVPGAWCHAHLQPHI